jgi:tetratricopeptide (TPR) repeat protein
MVFAAASLVGSSVVAQSQSRQAPSSRAAALAPDELLSRIAALLDHDLPGAKAAVDDALRAHPSDPALHNFAGVIAAQQHDAGAAETHFTTAIRLAPKAVPAYENLARLYQEQSSSNPEKALRAVDVYDRLLAIDPTHVEALYQSGFLLALHGRFAESQQRLERLPVDVQQRPQVRALLVADLAGLKRPDDALRSAESLAADPALTAEDVLGVLPALNRVGGEASALPLLEALEKRGVASVDLLTALSHAYRETGRYAEARRTLERAVATSGASVPLLLELARAADKSGDHQGALGYLAHARSLEPQNATVHFFFGMVCVELNLVREAYDALKQAVTLAPDNPLINYAMGAVTMYGHEPGESLPYFEAYQRLKPGDPRGRFALGVARFHANQFDQARRDLTAAAAHAETAAGAHYFLARIARQENDLNTARRELDDALRRNPKYADGWAELGLVQLRGGQYQDAQASLDKALALDPENYAATVNLATLYSRTKDPRREAQSARLAQLQEKRAAQAQEFLRIIEVVP